MLEKGEKGERPCLKDVGPARGFLAALDGSLQPCLRWGPWLSQGHASDRLMDLGEESPFSLPPGPTPPFFDPVSSSGSWLHLAVAGRIGSQEFQKLLCGTRPIPAFAFGEERKCEF